MGGSVWTASRETAEALAELDPNGLNAPRMTAASQGLAHLSDRGNRKVASGLTRLADGPFDHATQVAYTPQYEEIRDGLALTMTGRKLDQGVLACVVLDESRVAAVHHVALSENVPAKTCCASDSVPACGKIASRIEVPEFVHASLAGEWLIPKDGVLVVSLGVQTTADAAGRAVVAERLVLIEAAADDSVAPASLVQPLPDELGKPAPQRPASRCPCRRCRVDRCRRRSTQTARRCRFPRSRGPADPLVHTRQLGTLCQSAGSQPQAAGADDARHAPPPGLASLRYPRETRPRPRRAIPRVPYLLRFPVNAGGMNMEVEVRMASPSALFEKLRPSAPSR